MPWNLFNKTFFCVIYSKMAVKYGIFEIMSKFTVKILPLQQIHNLQICKVLWNRPGVNSTLSIR